MLANKCILEAHTNNMVPIVTLKYNSAVDVCSSQTTLLVIITRQQKLGVSCCDI